MGLRERMRTWDTSTVLMLWGLLAMAAASAVVLAGARLWARLSGGPDPGWDPIGLAVRIAMGRASAPAGMWACAGAVAGAAVLAALGAAIATRRSRARRRRGDEAAALTGRKRDTASLGRREVAAKARRLGVPGGAIGLPIGLAVDDRRALISDFESVAINISGPRMSKTTSWVIPRVLSAPGLVVATSNKRDILDGTIEQRSARGRAWVFDPQGLTDHPQQFWWNPLTYVTDMVQATALAQVFMDASRPAGGQTNAFFDTAARDLVASLLLAAACDGRPLVSADPRRASVHQWLSNQNNDEPVQVLRAHGHAMAAESLQGTLNLVPETRSGVYGGASQIMGFLLNEKAMRWAAPNAWLTELHVEDLIDSTDTLYLLSQEGRGSATPLMTALAVAVMEAAVARASACPGGRLPTPMLVMLDEAANVCRWSELPNQYSHFGSRGICVDTILQSWSQGRDAWGDNGIDKLWSSSNVKVYGGGVDDNQFLPMVSTLIGTHWVDSRQYSSSRDGSSTTLSIDSQERRIATEADLRAVPRGRAWVLSSGATAVYAELLPYWRLGEIAPAVGGPVTTITHQED